MPTWMIDIKAAIKKVRELEKQICELKKKLQEAEAK